MEIYALKVGMKIQNTYIYPIARFLIKVSPNKTVSFPDFKPY